MKQIRDRRWTRSTPLGAGLGAFAIPLSALAALWLSGHFQAFTENRGLLQVVFAIPVASLLTAGCIALSGVLDSAQLLWAIVPVGALILLVVAALGQDYATWAWGLAAGVILFVPWAIGVLIGSAISPRRSSGL